MSTHESRSPFSGPHLTLDTASSAQSVALDQASRAVEDAQASRLELREQVDSFFDSCRNGRVDDLRRILVDCESLYGSAFLVDLLDDTGTTATELAIANGRSEILEVLVNAKASLIFANGQSALERCVELNRPHALSCLLKLHRATVDRKVDEVGILDLEEAEEEPSHSMAEDRSSTVTQKNDGRDKQQIVVVDKDGKTKKPHNSPPRKPPLPKTAIVHRPKQELVDKISSATGSKLSKMVEDHIIQQEFNEFEMARQAIRDAHDNRKALEEGE